jgi:hypothetical protein
VLDPFDPNESTARFETRSGFLLYWPWVLFGGLAAGYAATFLPAVLDGRLTQLDGQWMMLAGGVGLLLLSIAGYLNWQRVKWVRTANRGGIQWSARGRVYHRKWDQLVHIQVHTTVMVDQEGNRTPVAQMMTATFDDGIVLRASAHEVVEYPVLVRYLEAKQQQAEATRRSSQNAAAQSAAERDAADRVTTFGPLGIYRRGVEWDGVYYPWEQVEGYEIQQGFLIIRTTIGDEFLRRLADLGDWHTVLERLAAAAGQMAGRRAAADSR